MAPYILYTTGQHQRLPRHLLAQQISPAAFIFNCLGSKTSRCHKAKRCSSEHQHQDGIIPFQLSAFTLSLNELIRRFAGSRPVCLLCVATTTHFSPHQTWSVPLQYDCAISPLPMEFRFYFIFLLKKFFEKPKMIKLIFAWRFLIKSKQLPATKFA